MKELDRIELQGLNGGSYSVPFWFKGSIYTLVAGYIINHWADLKAGLVDGYNDAIRDNK